MCKWGLWMGPIFPPCWKVLLRLSAASSQRMPKSRPLSAALSNEASPHSAGGAGSRRYCGLHSQTKSASSIARARRDSRIVSEPCFVSADWVTAEGRGRAQVGNSTLSISCLLYYSADESAEEIIIITIQHPAREREHSDAWSWISLDFPSEHIHCPHF
jgi:hypothetical protein